MKKLAVFLAVAVLIAFAAPVLAATNPFMDVPMNSWAYDAVAQLASKGILSGYPDGLYKGRQSMTRYEAASMVARALAYVDMTKASRQDVDLLKRLVIEFKDELDALGVRMDGIDKDMALFKRRLGGWRLSGRMRVDFDYRMRSDEMATDGAGLHGTSMGNIGAADARLNIDRFFGEDEKAFFRVQQRSRQNGSNWDNGRQAEAVAYFFATVPFVYDSFLTAGWGSDDDIDRRFGFSPDASGRYGNYGWFNDSRNWHLKLEKSFEMGDFYLRFGHPNTAGHGWEAIVNFNFNLNEQFGFGIGAHYFKWNNWDELDGFDPALDNSFTGWLGVDFNFMEGAGLHGIIYFQSKSGLGAYDESANAWRVAFDLSQDILKFTNFYAEYGRIGQDFWAREGLANNMMFENEGSDAYSIPDWVIGSIAPDDISFWKVGATQKWTDEFRTWLMFAQASMDNVGLRQYGLGLDYFYNSYTLFSLNYIKWQGLDDFEDLDYSRIRFTTQVSF